MRMRLLSRGGDTRPRKTGTCSYYGARRASLTRAPIRRSRQRGFLVTTTTSGNSLSVDDLGSTAQRERRQRILDATYTLAREGGYDAVQMRAVADQADVALGTLYRYFPSKVHLLVS